MTCLSVNLFINSSLSSPFSFVITGPLSFVVVSFICLHVELFFISLCNKTENPSGVRGDPRERERREGEKAAQWGIEAQAPGCVNALSLAEQYQGRQQELQKGCRRALVSQAASRPTSHAALTDWQMGRKAVFGCRLF